MSPLKRVEAAIEHQIASNAYDGDAVDFGRTARAAVEALKDLDIGTVEAMVTELDPAWQLDFPWGDSDKQAFSRAAFTAAIDRILKDGA